MIHQTTPRLAHAYADARLTGLPLCPLKPDARIEFEGTIYALEVSGYTGTSKTERLTVSIISEDTGRRRDIDVVRSYRQSKRTGSTSAHINRLGAPKGTKGWKGWDAAYAALVELAAPHLRGLVAHNPVTGAVVIPFRVGGSDFGGAA